jgi:hypothetical protein
VVDENDALSQQSSNKRMLFYEELFDRLHEAHLSTGHGRRDIMRKKLEDFHGIPREAVEVYLSLCNHCEEKKNRSSVKIVTNPITTKTANARCQMDLIDFRTHENDGYQWLLVYQVI